jgi:hypothetical protein
VIKTVIQASKGKKKAQTKPPATSSTTSDEERARVEEGEGSPIAAAAAATATAVAIASAAAAAEEEGEREKNAPMPLTSREVVQEIYDRAGVKGFFGGVQYAALQSALEKSIYFYAYSIMKGITKLLNGGR